MMVSYGHMRGQHRYSEGWAEPLTTILYFDGQICSGLQASCTRKWKRRCKEVEVGEKLNGARGGPTVCKEAVARSPFRLLQRRLCNLSAGSRPVIEVGTADRSAGALLPTVGLLEGIRSSLSSCGQFGGCNSILLGQMICEARDGECGF